MPTNKGTKSTTKKDILRQVDADEKLIAATPNAIKSLLQAYSGKSLTLDELSSASTGRPHMVTQNIMEVCQKCSNDQCQCPQILGEQDDSVDQSLDQLFDVPGPSQSRNNGNSPTPDRDISNADTPKAVLVTFNLDDPMENSHVYQPREESNDFHSSSSSLALEDGEVPELQSTTKPGGGNDGETQDEPMRVWEEKVHDLVKYYNQEEARFYGNFHQGSFDTQLMARLVWSTYAVLHQEENKREDTQLMQEHLLKMSDKVSHAAINLTAGFETHSNDVETIKLMINSIAADISSLTRVVQENTTSIKSLEKALLEMSTTTSIQGGTSHSYKSTEKSHSNQATTEASRSAPENTYTAAKLLSYARSADLPAPTSARMELLIPIAVKAGIKNIPAQFLLQICMGSMDTDYIKSILQGTDILMTQELSEKLILLGSLTDESTLTSMFKSIDEYLGFQKSPLSAGLPEKTALGPKKHLDLGSFLKKGAPKNDDDFEINL